MWSDTPCLPWQGYLTPKGYGRIGQRTAIRVLWEREHGPLPEGLELDHLCRYPACVNLDHLEPVTHAENQRRGLRGMLTTRCPKGHAYDEANTYWYGNNRKCRACRRDQQQEFRLRRKFNDPT